MSDNDLHPGSVEIRSAGPIAFGPDGILFLADNAGARIIAVDVADGGTEPSVGTGLDLLDVRATVAALLGAPADAIVIRDLDVHPVSTNVYLSVQRGTGDVGQAVLVRIDRADGSAHDIPLTDVRMSEIAIADAPSTDDERQDVLLPTGDEGEEISVGGTTLRIQREPIRTSTVTDMAYIDGDLLVAGLSNEEFSSKLRRIPFPFASADDTTDNNLEIFHVSHGKWETASPIRRFVPYDDGRSILAAYTCTPIVQFSLADAEPRTKTVGRTVAELGHMNQPLGMVAFEQDGEERLLVSNSSHGLLKLSRADIDRQDALTEPDEPVGVPRTRQEIAGVTLLANLGSDYVLALQNEDGGRQHLRSLQTASL